MKKTLLILALSFFMIAPSLAQPANLIFKFKETASNHSLRLMEQNAKIVFEEINNASRENRLPRFSSANMTTTGINNTLALWALSIFHCIEPAYIENVSTNIRNQYAVRNIAVYFKELPDESKRSQDLVIEFDKESGKISNITNVLERHQSDKILQTGHKVTDLRYRQYILEFVEEFRTAYNRQDINLIEKMFNDEALIISGTQIETIVDGKYIKKAVYKTQNKVQYIERLEKVIMKKDNNGKFVNKISVDFNDIEIIKSQNEEKIYLVKMRQKWDSKGQINYGDEGWLTLVIDFNDDEAPTIWVRAWELPDTPKSKTYDFNCFYAPGNCN